MSKPVAHYSASYRAGDLLFVSGQIGIAEGSLVDGVEAQTTQALANAQSVLDQNGLTLDDVVKCTVFMTDIENFSAKRLLVGAGIGYSILTFFVIQAEFTIVQDHPDLATPTPAIVIWVLLF